MEKKGGGKRSGEERYPARKSFRSLQDSYLDHNLDSKVEKLAAYLVPGASPVETQPGQAVYARIIEQLNEENRSLQLKLKLAEVETNRQEGANKSAAPAPDNERSEISPAAATQSTTAVEQPDFSDPLPELSDHPLLAPEPGEVWLEEIIRLFAEWSLPEQVLGEKRQSDEEFHDFISYTVFQEWLEHHPALLLVTDLSGNLLALSGPYRRLLSETMLTQLQDSPLAVVFDETAVMLFLHSPTDRSFPLVIDRMLLREVYVTRFSLILQSEPVGYLFQLNTLVTNPTLTSEAE
ncbi:MAG: hypothetical protein ISR91_04535 [Candidatus Delongbacteria bacterium]|nr:hypothetical protein [Candidatus Delongbacteria bacterium]